MVVRKEQEKYVIGRGSSQLILDTVHDVAGYLRSRNIDQAFALRNLSEEEAKAIAKSNSTGYMGRLRFS